jgi:hypothetical protein
VALACFAKGAQANVVGGGTIASGISLDWQIVGTPDLNSDGSPDILWRNTSTGDAGYWLMDGTYPVGEGTIAFNVPLEWHIVGTPVLH